MGSVRIVRLEAVALERFLRDAARIVGAEHVVQPDEARYAYADALAPRDAASYAPRAAVAPASTEEVQAVVRLARERRIPLWPISRGKNFGYGGAAPPFPE